MNHKTILVQLKQIRVLVYCEIFSRDRMESLINVNHDDFFINSRGNAFIYCYTEVIQMIIEESL